MMMMKSLRIALAGAVAVLLPCVLHAQDPQLNPQTSPYSPSSAGLNQPSGTGLNPQTGQPNTSMINQNGQTSSMGGSLGAPGETGQQMLDKQFLRNAAESLIAEVQFGKLATAKGSPAVQTLAQKLVDDHTTMSKDLDAVADSMAIMLPKKMNKEHQKEYDKLNGLSGKDFDREYLTYAATGHYEDLHVFHMEAAVAANPDLAAEVVNEMGMMHQHLGLIQNAAKDDGVMLPPRPPRPVTATASR